MIAAQTGSDTSLERVKNQWTTLGKEDPLWAILTREGKRGGRWEPAEFFQTGVAEIEKVIPRAQNLFPVRFGTAVDFGCGVGRLSQALAGHFQRVIGIDIAEPMIEAAIRFNRFPARCEYVLNTTPDLSMLPGGSIDFLYSNITLQHMAPSLARLYIREFFRIARPGGHVIFQLPTRPRSRVWYWIKAAMPVTLSNLFWRWRTGSPEAIESYFLAEKSVKAVVEGAEGSVVFMECNSEGPQGWLSRKYFCVKTERSVAAGPPKS